MCFLKDKFSIIALAALLCSCSGKNQNENAGMIATSPIWVPIYAPFLIAAGASEVDKKINVEKYKKDEDERSKQGKERELKKTEISKHFPKKLPTDFLYKGNPISPESFRPFFDGITDKVKISTEKTTVFYPDDITLTLRIYGKNSHYEYLGKIGSRHLVNVIEARKNNKNGYIYNHQLRFVQIQNGQLISKPEWLIYKKFDEDQVRSYDPSFQLPFLKNGKVYYLQVFSFLNREIIEKYDLFKDKSFLTRPNSATILWEFDCATNKNKKVSVYDHCADMFTIIQ